MRNRDDQNKLVELLSETPQIAYVCKKIGVSRATFYRWMKDNLEFRQRVEKALAMGRENWREVAESMLFKNIKDGNMNAVRFFLTHNDPRYIPIRTVFVEPPKPEQLVEPGEICEKCGETKPIPKTFIEMAEMMRHFTYEPYTEKQYQEYLKSFYENHKCTNPFNRKVDYTKDSRKGVVTQPSAYELDGPSQNTNNDSEQSDDRRNISAYK